VLLQKLEFSNGLFEKNKILLFAKNEKNLIIEKLAKKNEILVLEK
jgi:hypothetical protein